MAAKKKTGAAAAAPTEQAGKDAAASAAVPAPSPETSVPADDATDAPAAADPVAADTAPDEAGESTAEAGGDAELDALNTANVVELLEQTDPQAAAEVAAVGVDTAATVADRGGDALAFPLRVRVTNRTRMPVQLAVVPLDLRAAPDAQTVTVPGQREYDAMLTDLSSLRALNGFDEDAFVVEPLTEEDE